MIIAELHFIEPCACIALYEMAWSVTLVWYEMVWHDLVQHGMMWYDMYGVLYLTLVRMSRYGTVWSVTVMVWYDMVYEGMEWYDIYGILQVPKYRKVWNSKISMVYYMYQSIGRYGMV